MSNPIQDVPIDPLHRKKAIRQSIRENAAFTVPYVTMNALATVVACYGLLQNSTAVVIGAMIIAMLLGPISGIALALVSGDNALLVKALLAEVGGVLVVLGVAFCIGKIHQDLPLTAEILSRTSPNILDLMIALADGGGANPLFVHPGARRGPRSEVNRPERNRSGTAYPLSHYERSDTGRLCERNSTDTRRRRQWDDRAITIREFITHSPRSCTLSKS